jgi:hypothetical protein
MRAVSVFSCRWLGLLAAAILVRLRFEGVRAGSLDGRAIDTLHVFGVGKLESQSRRERNNKNYYRKDISTSHCSPVAALVVV